MSPKKIARIAASRPKNGFIMPAPAVVTWDGDAVAVAVLLDVTEPDFVAEEAAEEDPEADVLAATEVVLVEAGAAEVEVEVAVEAAELEEAVVEALAEPEAAVAAQEQTASALVWAANAVLTPQAEITQTSAEAAIAELEAGLH